MNKVLDKLASFIFWSRWLQAPLYVGLIGVQGVYVYEFIKGFFRLVMNATHLNETAIMLSVLDLIDVVMIANLLVMVIIGGYESFVSRLKLKNHPDEPEWLDHVNAGTMKIKLAVALISISAIHLLKTFINPAPYTSNQILWQVVIHMTFVVSALLMAFTNKLTLEKSTIKIHDARTDTNNVMIAEK